MKNSLLICTLALLLANCTQNTPSGKQPAAYASYKELGGGYFLKNTIAFEQPIAVLTFSNQDVFDRYFGFGKTMQNNAGNIDFATHTVLAIINNTTDLETTLLLKNASQTGDSLIFRLTKTEGAKLSYQSVPLQLFTIPNKDAAGKIIAFVNDQNVPVQDAASFAPIASTYIINDFLLAIALTKSPYKVSKTANYPLFGFSFTKTQLTGYTIHEGGYDTDLQFEEATNKYIGKGIPGLEPFELTVTDNGDVQLLFLKSKKAYTYKKVPDADTAVREILLAGAYTDTKTRDILTFNADGTLTGMGTEKTYQPFYDFMGPLSFDEMVVQEKSDPTKTTYFHYKIKDTTLELYESIQSENGEEIEKIGKLLYTLERVKK